MILRIAKVTVKPGGEEELIAVFRRHSEEGTRHVPGNYAARLFRCEAPVNLFFVHTWWKSAAVCARFVASDRYTTFYNETRAVLLERIEVWMTEIDDEDPCLVSADTAARTRGASVPHDGDAALRVAKVTVRPGSEQRFAEVYREATATFLRPQEGVLSVRLFRCAAPPNTFFTETWWRSAADARRVSGTDRYARTLSVVQELLEERIKFYALALADEDPRCG